jgi:hypothetical protein
VGLGLESTAMPVLVISVSIVTAYWLGKTSGLQDSKGLPTGGLFGTAVATMGMLSTAGYVLTMDMFGPIADNAGGIVEMSQQVRLSIYLFCDYVIVGHEEFEDPDLPLLSAFDRLSAARKCSGDHGLAGCCWQHN